MASLAKTGQKLAHELIADTAKEIAGAFYEEAAQVNDFFAYYPKQHIFIKNEWHRFVEAARQVLVSMLGNPVTPEWQKEQIHEALILHASLPGNVDRRVAKMLIDEGDITSQIAKKIVVH